MSTRIDQLLHGYRRGHERLAGSMKLTAKDSELVARLSDLSGTPVGPASFAPYLTVYPLPSGCHFAIAKTWPDIHASRSGCVLTHTLLIPTDFWQTLSEPRTAVRLLCSPVERPNDDAYEQPLMWPTGLENTYSPVSTVSIEESSNFANLYFAKGKRPVVWFGHPDAYDALWRILTALWPALRTRFASCTFCLQPRTLDDRPFDLMFAPDDAYPRFLKVDSENLLEHTRLPTVPPAEDWCKRWAQRMFGAPRPDDSLDADLFKDLDDDPTAIRRLYLIETAMRSDTDMPQAAVGAMDLVESVARKPDLALHTKAEVAKRAVTVAAAAKDVGDGLESLRLVEDRLRRPSFSRVAAQIGPLIASAVASRTARDPERVVELTPGAQELSPDADSSWYALGIVEGFRQLALQGGPGIAALRGLRAIRGQLFVNDPSSASAYIRALITRRREPDVRRAIRDGLLSVQLQLPVLRCSLLCELTTDDSELMSDLLKGLSAEEVSSALDAVRPLLHDAGIAEAVNKAVARKFPDVTRSWARSISKWSTELANLLAATYPVSRQGLVQLLEDDKEEQQAQVLTAYLSPLAHNHFPIWIKKVTAEDQRVLATLLRPDASVDSRGNELVLRLLNECDELPIAHFPLALSRVGELQNRKFFPQLLTTCLRDLIRGYLNGSVPEAAALPILQMPATSEWFRESSDSELTVLLIHQVWSRGENWLNTWKLLLLVPRSLYEREPPLLPEVIDALLRAHYTSWSPAVAHSWAEILRRTCTDCLSHRTRLVLRVQALKYAIYHTGFPLSEVVAETFFDVYRIVTTPSGVPPEASSLFGFFDWDKGKELRKSLINSFMSSNWPPGDMLLAAKESALFRKIFKRIYRETGGKEYLRSMLADVETRASPEAQKAARMLASLLGDPDFYEEWD